MIYTLKDVRQSTFDKMFLDKSEHEEYRSKFFTEINDAILELCKRFPLHCEFTINKNAETDSENEYEVYDLIDLTKSEEDTESYRKFMSFAANPIYKLTSNGLTPFNNYFITADRFLYIPANENGIFKVFYNGYHSKIYDTTHDDFEMEFEPEVTALLPLLCAHRIFLEDDQAVAMTYYNEYIQALEGLLRADSVSSGIKISGGYDL